VRSYLGDLSLEDLPIPILICTEDLVSKREIRLAEGDFYTVMEAAYALPVYFPPVPYGPHILIDGGITNLVPLGVAYDYTDTVIVSSTFYDAKGLNLRNPLIILNTAIDIGKRRAGVADLLDHPSAVWIRCDVESFSFMAFDSIDVLAATGYRSAAAMAGAFRDLPANGVDPALLALRSSLDQRIPQVMRDWKRFERAPLDSARMDLALGLVSYAHPGDRWLLRDSVALETSLGLRTGNLEASIALGMDWEAYGQGAGVPQAVEQQAGESQTGEHQAIAPAAALAFAWYPVPALGLFSYGSGRWEGDEADLSWYARNGLHAAFAGGSGGLRMDLRSYLEHRLDADLGLVSMLLTSSAGLSLAGPGLSWAVEGGHQLTGGYDQHLGFSTASMQLGLGGQVSFLVSALVRGGLSTGTMAPLFLSDNFGALDPSRYSGLSRVLTRGSLGMRWSPTGFRPSFGELLLLKNSSLELYSDFLWQPGYAGDIPVVAGVRLRSELSLIGLESSSMQGELGYDFDAGAYVLRVFLF
ncbi:MAG: patatin-like phospholipase family protein, partial [Spirochaetota bacterium]